MFEVHCPSCRASYQVDERRVPPTGLKMRCPKCGESFQVDSPKAAGAPPVLGAALGIGSTKATVMGGAAPPPRPAGPPAAPPRPGGLKQTMIGVAPAAAPKEKTGLELEDIEDIEPEATSELEMDLPSASAHPLEEEEVEELDLPAPRSPAGGGFGLDLSASPPAKSVIELPADSSDLPEIPGVLGGAPRRNDSSEFDLPAPRGVGAELPDLPGFAAPAPSARKAPSFEDLPDLGADLPTPYGDLPAVSDIGLPTVGGELPALGGSLPALGGSLPSVASGLPSLSSGLPEHVGPASINLPSASDRLGSGGANRSGDPNAFGEVDFGGGDASADDIFGGNAARPEPGGVPRDAGAFGEVNFGGGGAGDDDEFDAFPTEKGDEAPRKATGYGDVTLEGGAGDLALGADVQREPAPAGPPAAATAQVMVPGAVEKMAGPKIMVPKAGISTTTKVVIVGGLVLAVGGGLLGLLPDVGPYGAYFLIDQIKTDTYVSDLARDVKQAQKSLALDTAKDLDVAYREVTRGQGDAPRFRSRQAYRAYLGLFRLYRFGSDSPNVAEAKVLLNQLRAEERTTEKHFDLAELAEMLTLGKFADIQKRGAGLVSRSADHAAIVGEAALRLKDFALAESAFRAVLAAGDSARGNFGLARVSAGLGKVGDAKTFGEKTRALSPKHVQSELLEIELALHDITKDETFGARLTTLASGQEGTSPFEKARALTLLGRLHLVRSRLKQSETAFGEALKLTPGDSDAQVGLAETLFASGRYAEALARFEAGLKADPKSLDAELGIVQAKLRLEALADAAKILDRLLVTLPKSTRVQYWQGRAKEAVGEREAAEKCYEIAIESKEESPELVMAYVALTRLYSQVGKLAAAERVIGAAKERFPNSPEVYRALAELASSRGQYEEAIVQLDKALTLDEKNVGLRFLRGIALRQARKFEDAMAEFDEVEKVEKDYPGLALERGNLYEAAGHTEEALKSYEAALAAAPNDIDLKLRVGCGKASAGQTKASLELLDVVFEARPQSAEVNYCIGLAYLREGKKLPEAKRYFERSISLDMTRANYHLYLGWVSIELRDYAVAEKELDRALVLDQTIADGYWQRGVLRVRQGAVKDAETDLRRALELSPSRYEAHATLAEAYAQSGREPDALVEWKAAIDGGVAEPFWHYSYGKLLVDNHKLPEAEIQLTATLEKLEKKGDSPPWIWDAHRLLAIAMGRVKPALLHWQKFAENQPNSPYAPEAVKEMKAILAMP